MVGYARVSRSGTDGSDQRAALLARGVTPDRVYIDIGLTGMTRPRPALGEAMAACRDGDTLVVTRLARLAQSVRDAHELLGRLSAEQVTLAIGDERFVLAESDRQILLQVLALSWDLQVAVVLPGRACVWLGLVASFEAGHRSSTGGRKITSSVFA